MSTFKPFKALRPKKEYAKNVCCLPYDVLSESDIKSLAENELCFVHVIRSEVDMPDECDVYSDEVYKKAAQNLEEMQKKGVLVQDSEDSYYIYSQKSAYGTRYGLCGLISNEEYRNGTIKRHEFTIRQKETDRLNHFLACSAHTEPVFLLYKENKELKSLISTICEKDAPEYNFTDAYGVNHRLWPISEKEMTKKIEELIKKQDCLYIADGHHRTASACRVEEELEKRNIKRPSDDYKYTMAVIFPADELCIIDYNRMLTDTAPYTADGFIEALKKDFTVEKLSTVKKAAQPHQFAFYIAGSWYLLTAKEGSFDSSNPVARLDAAILQENVFSKLLDIKDPRSSKRLSFVGGNKGYEKLSKAVDDEGYSAAFALFPVSCDMLMDVADSNEVMPPKSTWFEPKLSSGLFIHKF